MKYIIIFIAVFCSVSIQMNNRKRPAAYSSSRNLDFWSSSFQRQPARVLIVDALPPWWSDTRVVICDALDNFLSLTCGLDGPCRIPLLSLYAVSMQPECLLPFVVRYVISNSFSHPQLLLFIICIKSK